MGALATAAAIFALGPDIEARLFPVLTQQAIPVDSVSRIGQALCWSWVRDATRAPDRSNVTIAIESGTGADDMPDIFDARSGLPVQKTEAARPGHHDDRFCATVPASLSEAGPVRFRQVLTYRGFMGLWTIRAPLPVITAD